MLEFISNNWDSLIVVITLILALLGLLRLGKQDTVKKIILSLVVQAEKALGSGTGDLKYAYVIDNLYDKLPAIVSMLFSKKEIDTMIEQAVAQLKKLLSEGVTLSGYEEEKYLKVIEAESSAGKVETDITKSTS